MKNFVQLNLAESLKSSVSDQNNQNKNNKEHQQIKTDVTNKMSVNFIDVYKKE